MKQKRFQRCFICHNPETLLVRYLLATRIKKNQVDLHKKYKDKRQHIKTLFMRTADFEKKTITQTYMFICVNTSCWRFCNYEKLKEEWDIKNWRERKKVIILTKKDRRLCIICEGPITGSKWCARCWGKYHPTNPNVGKRFAGFLYGIERKENILSPDSAILIAPTEIKVGILTKQHNEKIRIVQAVQVEPEESKARRPHESRVQAEVGGQGMACYA